MNENDFCHLFRIVNFTCHIFVKYDLQPDPTTLHVINMSNMVYNQI